MAKVERTVLIEHSAPQMFDLVDTVEDYPKFLPWCSHTSVDYRDEKKTIATLHIQYLSMKSHFTTENAKDIPVSMHIKLVDGPFHRLEGAWHFTALSENACKIDFQLAYEFSSRLFEKLIGPLYGQIINTFVDAFIKRADEIYGVSRCLSR